MTSRLTFEEADDLLKRILVFLKKQGGPYTRITDVGNKQRVILSALARGHFYFDNETFVCWEFFGDLMHVHEAAGKLTTIRRVLRKNIKQGLSFYRHNRNNYRLVSSAKKRC